MGKPSSSYLTFEQVILRSHNLVSLHDSLVQHLGTMDPALDFSDLLRAAVVLSVASMDAYYTDIFAERLVPFLKKKGCNQDLATLLEEAGLDASVALELLSMDRPFRRVRTLIESHLDRHVTQRLNIIDDLFNAYGIRSLSTNAEKKLKRKRLCREIELLVERRHVIAHDGDLDKHGKLIPLGATWVRNRIKDVQKFVSACDEILRNQLG